MPTLHDYEKRLVRPCAYAQPEVKTQFHNTARMFLKALGSKLTPHYGEYEVRSNKGGIAVSGEVTLHMDRLYVQASQSVMGNDKGLLVRSCNGRKDYLGGQNYFFPLKMLVHTDMLAHDILRYIPKEPLQ